ncbi:MAG: hypothetical protein R3E65_08180, partial [Steroidobacteraceae bacterium]
MSRSTARSRWVGVMALSLAAATGAQAQETQTPPPSTMADAVTRELEELVAQSRYVVGIENEQLVGSGVGWLRDASRTARFVVLGEEHGNGGLAAFARAYWRELRAVGFEYAAFEIDPWVAAEMERTMRRGGVGAWNAFLRSAGGPDAVPFFGWRGEADLAAAVTSTTTVHHVPRLWGLDQVFLGIAPYLLRQIAESTRDSGARRSADSLYREARADSQWLGRVAPSKLRQLREMLATTGDISGTQVVDAMIVSRSIYGAFIGTGERNPYLANLQREQLMKRAFHERYRAATTADGAPARVLVKVGAYHAFRGATPTHVQGLGGFVSELAIAEDAQALTILLVCGPGSAIRTNEGELPCSEWFAKTWGALEPQVEREAFTM